MRRIVGLSLLLLFAEMMVSIGQTTVVLKGDPSMKDACINSVVPNSNYKDYPNYFAWAMSIQGDFSVTRSPFEFDLSSIPYQAVILDAKLDLYYAINSFNPGLSQLGQNASYIKRITEDWREEDITWANQPATTDENQVTLSESTSYEQDYLGIDVTLLVQDMVNNPQESHGFMLRLVDETMTRAICFASSDNPDQTLRPVLTIIYEGCNSPGASFDFLTNDRTVEFQGISETALSWLWDFGDGNGSYLRDPVHQYEQYGVYHVCLTVEDTCGSSTDCKTLIICHPTIPGFGWTNDGLTVNFTDSSSNAVSWNWDFGDGYISSLQNPVHTYLEKGNYTACLRTENECSLDSICKTVEVNYSGLDEPDNAAGWNIFPNPFFDRLSLSASETAEVTIQLFDGFGTQVLEKRRLVTRDETATFVLKELPPGLYLLFVTDQQGLFFTKKVIKQPLR